MNVLLKSLPKFSLKLFFFEMLVMGECSKDSNSLFDKIFVREK